MITPAHSNNITHAWCAACTRDVQTFVDYVVNEGVETLDLNAVVDGVGRWVARYDAATGQVIWPESRD